MKFLLVLLLLGFIVGCDNSSADTFENLKQELNEYSNKEVTEINDTMLLKKDMKPVNGFVNEKYSNGQLKSEEFFKDGVRNGIERGWYENGQLQYELTRKNGISSVQEWYENGQLMSEEFIKDGNHHGSERGWHENGQLHYELSYKDGKANGVNKRWYENGQLHVEANFKDGKFHGHLQNWYPSGNIKFDVFYKNDSVLNEKCFDDDGSEIICQKQWLPGIYYFH